MFDPQLPLSSASTIPASWYTGAEMAQREQDRLFPRTWLCAGRADQVEQPGQFFTINVANEPIVVVRGEDGILRAFYNVCRHRAARVVTQECGETDRLRCPYHGWTYDLSGTLRGVPEFDGVEGFRREDNGLPPIHVEVWGPLVFIHQSWQGQCHGDAALPSLTTSSGSPGRISVPRQLGHSLAEHLHPMKELLAPYQLDKLHCIARKEYILNCNWKIFVDNFLDGGYHVNAIHPSLAGVLDYKNYKTECFTWTSVQSSPLKQPSTTDNASAAAVRQGKAAAYWWIFPNLMLNAYEGVMDTNLVLPLGPDRCRVLFDFYFPRTDTSPEANARQQESIRIADQIQAEDVGICEDVQLGLRSRSFNTGRYSVRREQGVYNFHRLLAAMLD